MSKVDAAFLAVPRKPQQRQGFAKMRRGPSQSPFCVPGAPAGIFAIEPRRTLQAQNLTHWVDKW